MDDHIEKKQYRKIIHIDMDSFYASVEQRDNPELLGKAIAVGGSPEGRGGVVATASYEARKYGVHSAMSSKQALKLCPHLIFVYPRFAAYKEVSRHIREIFHRYTDLIQPLSLDEAYLDVTDDKLGIGSAIDIAKEIKQAIKEELQLTASAGVSVNKFVAKIASDMNKPDGLTFIGPSKVEKFIEQLPVEKFYGVGKVTAAKMKLRGLHYGADLKRLSETELANLFGKSGLFFYKIVRGIDNRPVEPNQETKSVGAEDTFSYDLTELAEMNGELEKISQLVFNRIKLYHLSGRTVTVKVKFSDFKQITRSKSFAEGVTTFELIFDISKSLLAAIDFTDRRVRLLGISISNFENSSGNERDIYQPRLFP
ncbi:DNA polymerase IV [Pedobacter hiemivivus]|uniref:DNA polymerase IV n=1 Tax=Pedobacter hiemivivus TaxID=2530454 RepID=A0A4U1GDM1_9SPHI|nr:DNA polymerase IV [Pedobacter hiemivivus]TKC62161.1 DNA polymerase IV [Pedobacter hiemivivus]